MAAGGLVGLSAMLPCRAAQAPGGMRPATRFPAMASRFIAPRDIRIWLPDAWHEAGRPVPVVYINDLASLPVSDGPWHDASGPNGQIAALAAAALSWPAIVVGIARSTTALRDYAPALPLAECTNALREQLEAALGGPSLSDSYLKFIVAELKPTIDRCFATASARRHTFIAGAGLAGLVSLYALTRYPGVFGGAASLSTEEILIPPEGIDPLASTAWQKALGFGIERYLTRTLPPARTHRLYIDYSNPDVDALSRPLRSAVERAAVAKGYRRHRDFESLSLTPSDRTEQGRRERADIAAWLLLKAGFDPPATD